MWLPKAVLLSLHTNKPGSGSRDLTSLHGRMISHVVVVVLLLLLGWPHLCASETAYVVPSLEQDVPSNHSFKRLGSLIANAAAVTQYDTILLTTDYRVQPNLFPLNEPVSLSHNLTIASANYSTQGYRLFELEFATNRMLIPQGLTLTLKDLALGRARKTSGQGLPFFVGEGERSLLVLDNVIRIRTACAHNEPELISALQSIGWRGAVGPNGSVSRQQEVELWPRFTYKGKEFDDNIHAVNLRYFVGPVDVPDTNYYAGYTMVQINSTRVCETYVSDECVIKRGADVCVMDQIDALAKIGQPTPKQSPSSDNTNVAVIVAPSVVCGTLLVVGAAAALLWARKRRRHRLQDSRQSLLPVAIKPGGGSGGSGSGPHLLGSPGSPGAAVADPTTLPGPYSGAVGSIESLAIGNRAGSWRLAAFHTAPEFEDATPDDKLRLGLLLGAGSFGRVYKGVWRQADVAVKVLQHDSTTAAAIANEVDLVMSFRHPNIVAAYYFVTWKRSKMSQDNISVDGPSTGTNKTAAAAPGSAAAPHPQQPALVGPVAPRGRALEPVVESASISNTTQQSSTQHSAGGTVNWDADQPGSGTTTRTSIGSRRQVWQGPADGGKQQGVDTQSSAYCSSASGSSINMMAVLTGNSSSMGAHSGGFLSGGAVTAAPLVLPGSPTLPQQQPSSSRAGASTNGVSRWIAVQQQQQQPSFVWPILPARQLPDGNITSTSSIVGAGAAQMLPAGVKLVPYTAHIPQSSTGSDSSEEQQPQAMSAGGSATAAYEVSSCATLRSPSGLREAPVSSSTGGGTSSSCIAASFGSSQQQQLRLHQLSPDGLNDPDQQAVKAGRGQHLQQQSAGLPVAGGCAEQQQQSQQQLQLQRPLVSSNSPVISSSGRPSGSDKPAAARARSADEAQTWLIFEYCDGGTLLDLLAEDGALGPHVTGRRRLAQVLELMLDIAAGMSYLHSRNVLHGDLKPCNVLIKHAHGAAYGRVAKVSDFGLSRALQAGQSHRSTRTFGTLNHTPPELLRLGRLSPAGDIYAFGIMLWEAYTGRVAFSGLHYGEVFELVALLQQRPEIPADMPAAYADLVRACWAADPMARPPFTAVKQALGDMLHHPSLMQDEAEAQERFIADL